MKECISFMLDSTDHSKEIDKLHKLLENTGAEAKIITKKIGDNKFSYLNIVYDDEIVKVKKKRNAGRHYIGYLGRYTVENIKTMQETMTNKEIASILGISERTFYRRLKENSMNRKNEEFL